MEITIFLIGVALAAIFWIYQLWSVVSSDDADYPNRNDKLMWAMVVLFGSVLGALLFVLWKFDHALKKDSQARLKRTLKPPDEPNAPGEEREEGRTS